MNLKIDFLKFLKPFALLSILVVSFCLYEMFWGKGFKYGTDFSGGIEITATFKKAMTVETLLEVLNKEGLSAEVQPVVNEEPRFYIRQTAEDKDLIVIEKKLKDTLIKNFGEEEIRFDQVRSVGGVISSENKNKAFTIVFWVIIAIVLYITVRFKFQYGLAAIIAVIHDVAIMLGALVITGKEINVFTITAALTIFGYSVNDTIILFDRIREYIKEKKELEIKSLINHAINSVLARTLITSLTTLTVVAALFFNSQGALQDFSFALMIGLVVGTYSSIYVAVGVLLLWNKYRPLM